MRFLRYLAIFVLLLGGALWALNTNLFVQIPKDAAPKVLSHRGVHQTYAGDDRSNDSCTASPIDPIKHTFLENTISSMQAAFEAGADVIELDVHLTPDGVFAVFHDWTVDCRTDGTGVTEELTFAELQKLDIAHGYTADGLTYPLRGTGVGMMPSLRQVFDAQIGALFLINFKSKRVEEGHALLSLLKSPEYRNQVWGVYGGPEPTEVVVRADPQMRGFDKGSVTNCLKNYIALGWSGYVPQACRETVVGVPQNIAPLIWGWPHRFSDRMAEYGTDVILWGPYDGSGFSSGVDTLQQADAIPNGFSGYVWTNKIEEIGPHLR